MNCILLLAAGFSRNWNGRLASEMRAELQTLLRADEHLLRLLQRHDFETVVSIVQADFDRTPNGETRERLRRAQNAVGEIFRRMNDMFLRRGTLEFGNDTAFMSQKWLTRFDAIFTLNQDLLLEFHYLNNNPAVWMGSKWYPHGWAIPGVPGGSRARCAARCRPNTVEMASDWGPHPPTRHAAVFQTSWVKQLGDRRS